MLANSSKNLIYDNYFQNSENVGYEGSNLENVWNTTQMREINIVGGPFIGGKLLDWP